MGMTVTLGGDRLGAGKKQQVAMHGYERSTHDLSYIWRSTMAAGTLVPFMVNVALPGDTFDIELDADVLTHPTIGPLFGSYKLQLDLFEAPIRLYQAMLHNNALNIGLNMAQIKLPQVTLKATSILNMGDIDVTDFDNTQINPSCIFSYLGIRGVGYVSDPEDQERNFNAIPFIAYWDIYKNYYANKQEEIGAVIHSEPIELDASITEMLTLANEYWAQAEIPINSGAATSALFNSTVIRITHTVSAPPNLDYVYLNTSNGTYTLNQLFENVTTISTTVIELSGYRTGQYLQGLIVNFYRYATPGDILPISPKIETFPLSQLDDMRNAILGDIGNPAAFTVNTQANYAPYNLVLQNVGTYNAMMQTQEGLALKTYQSDLFNNWMKTDWITGPGSISDITAVNTENGFFTIDTLNLANKVYNMLNRIALSGGSYNDWVTTVYDGKHFMAPETPMYQGGLSKEIVFQEVVSNAASDAQPLGTLAGRGVLSKKHKGGKSIINVKEPSYLMGIVSITPRLDYSQGNTWDTTLKTMDDFHKPALDEIGFQDLIQEQMAWWTTNYGSGQWVQKSAGKVPAWINYMTAVNQVRGNFAIRGNEMFMTLNRRYEKSLAGGPNIDDLTTYIDPVKFNNIFAETSLDAQNFWVQIAVNITARRKMSAKIIPNL